MKPFEIKYLIAKAGHTQSQIAEEAGVSNAMVSRVIHGIKSYNIASRISAITGVSIEELFPGQYDNHRQAA